MQTLAYALGILGLSATISGSQFFYSKNPFRRTDECNICYANDCLVLDEARCDYYLEVDTVLPKDDEKPVGELNPPLQKEVDSLLFDFIDKANGVSDMECIPYISRYTDCNKENVCIGCQSCLCDSDGKWNCSSSTPCHVQDIALNIDHRILVMALESLANRSFRLKRSILEMPEEVNVTEHDKDASTITMEQMSEWLYGVKPLNKQEYSPTESEPTDATVYVTEEVATGASTTESDTAQAVQTTTATSTEAPNISESDYVAFDEVLRSIAVDTKSYNRRKLPLDDKPTNKTFDVDYMLMDDDKIAHYNDTDEFGYIVNFMTADEGVTESAAEGVTKIVIDLLETASRNAGNFNDTPDFDFFKNDDIATGFENTNDIIEYNAVNIMKREIATIDVPSVVPAVTLIVNTTSNTNTTNTTDQPIDLKENILIPLNKIISDKLKELEDLKRIKENLLFFFKTDDERPDDMGNVNNTNNTYFSIYNVVMDMDPMMDMDLRRSAPNGLDKYLSKLKRDIFEVIKDVLIIQKRKNTDLPEDLKYLIHAMKRYVYNTKFNESKTNKIKSKQINNTRRQMEQEIGRCDYLSFKDCITQIIEVIDRNMPKSHALSPLSTASRKIMRHVIHTHYIDEFAAIGLRVHDPQYNLTNDLKNVGSKWQEMTAKITSSSPFVALYRMKMLHFVLTMDINKMIDALALVDFAHSRRMFPTLDNVSDDILERINAGLKAIHNKIQIIIRYYSKKPKQPITYKPRSGDETTLKPSIETIDTRKKKKRSFIKHIRSLLKSSKKDIAELLHRKVPKSEIVKQLARKKLDELSEKRYNEYEETMKRWQRNLDLVPRIKRSVLDMFKARIKNIIPNYLRHKVTPRIKEKKKNATDERKKKRKKHDYRNRRTTTPTTKHWSEFVTPRITKVTTRAFTSATVKWNLTKN